MGDSQGHLKKLSFFLHTKNSLRCCGRLLTGFQTLSVKLTTSIGLVGDRNFYRNKKQ
jgi:hypothetical protein